MCGRYLSLSLEQMKSLTGLSPQLSLNTVSLGEVFPSQKALVLTKDGYEIIKWGFKKWDGKGIIINARQETLLQKHFFKHDFKHHRALILTRGFFEWDHNKVKYLVEGDDPIVYLAGFYKIEESGEKTFVIITQTATPEFITIHNRLPLIIEASEIKDYLSEGDDTLWTLPKQPHLNIKKAS